jgi:hypothetical protein
MHPQRIASIRRAVAALAVALFLVAWLATFAFGARGRSTAGTSATAATTSPSTASRSADPGFDESAPDPVITSQS